MHEKEIERASTTEGLPVSVSLGPVLEAADFPRQSSLVNARVLLISSLAICVGIASAFIAQALMRLISFVTHVSFYGEFSSSLDDQHYGPANNHLGLWVIAVPVIGGVIVGFMARYGHKAIRGHGIPEAMEQVLLNESRIPPRITFLKPLSAAIAIGTGGPFGAEGPIIATGGALGSLVGQIITTSAIERKTLLAAGAAAGMAATFGSPVSAVLLAIELLLFEFRARSIIPVALAAVAAAGVRVAFDGVHPVFAMPDLPQPAGWALAVYIVLGGLVGIASVGVTRAVYWVEDMFEHLPVHWMWWPAIGAVAVGAVGYFYPRTLGVGYSNISQIISVGTPAGGELTIKLIAILCLMKFISWVIALGSGTSGGTLAPLFTIGGALGTVLGAFAAHVFPHSGIDIRVAALVGMAAIFAGASRAMLASAVFAFETTLQPLGLLPLLGGCTAAYFASALLMRNTIMTEKIARRGVRVPAEYEADFLDQIAVSDVASKGIVTLRGNHPLAEVRQWIESAAVGTTHQGFPVLNENGHLIGVLTRRDLLNAQTPGETKIESMIRRRPSFVYDDCTLRDAADHMVRHEVGKIAGGFAEGVVEGDRDDYAQRHPGRASQKDQRCGAGGETVIGAIVSWGESRGIITATKQMGGLMTLKIDISPELEARLKEAASRHGLDEVAYTRQLIENNVVPSALVRDQATLDLLAKWDAESKASTPEEIAEAQREWEEFKKAMNENSMSGRPIYP